MWKNLFQITLARVIISFLLLLFVVFVGKLLTTPRGTTEVTIELDGIKSSCPAWVTFYGTTAKRKEMAFAIFYPLLKHNPDLCSKLPQAVGRRVIVSFKKNVVNTVDGEISVNEVTGLRFILPESLAPKAPVQRRLPASAASVFDDGSGFLYIPLENENNPSLSVSKSRKDNFAL